MKDPIVLYEITPQEEIFCQHYVISINTVFSAYHSGMCSSIKDDVKFDDITIKERGALQKAGNRALNKNTVKKRISEIATIEATKNSCATLDEILSYLTICIRQSKDNIKNTLYMNSALKAIDVLIKRYPDFHESSKTESMHFRRGV